VRTVRANWVVALVAFLVCVLIGAAYAVLPAKQYQATVVLLAQPPAGSPDPGSDVNAIQIEIPQIVVEADTSIVADQTRALVPARYRSTPAKLGASGDPASNSLTVTASSTDPAVAQAYANALAARMLQLTNREASTTLILSELGPAQLPTTPTNPRKTVLVASIAFGLIAAVFAALAGAAVRRRLATADEIRDRVGLTVLGEVPTLVHAGGGPAEIFESTGDQRALEAFQQLRSSLHILFQDANPTIAVTSWEPREGKSSVASHVAWALAIPGRSVVAVDCDLRKPALHQIFGAPLSPGVSDFFAFNDPAELMTPTGNRNLELIPAGVPGRHPADIVTTDVPRLLGALHESDRTVIVDCPPLSGVAETRILVADADAVVLVVDARKFDPDRLEHSLVQLRASGANVVGIVLNRVRRRRVDEDYGFYGLTNSHETKTKRRWLARLS
jgi:capsular exopolysaccharide synthesis family protein